ncbi:MAG TPA: carbohydrate ABC transporter permease, partial [Ruminiclostridium sp.]
IILTILTVVVIIPYIWIIANSLQESSLIGKNTGLIGSFIPTKFTFASYIEVGVRMNLVRVMFNTIFVAVAVTLSALILNSMAGYAFARLKFKGKNTLFALLLLTYIVPFEVLVIPLYHTVRQLNMVGTYWALIVPAAASAYGIFFFRQFFEEIPNSLEEAAIVDGANKFKIYTSIMLPLVKAPMVTLGIITFLGQWDNFLWAYTVVNSEKMNMLQVALVYVITGQMFRTNWGVMFAGVVVSALPMIILFIILQKYYVENIAFSGIKG